MKLTLLGCALLALPLSMTTPIQAQEPAKAEPAQAAAPSLLAQGTIDFDTPEFNFKLSRSSQTVAALQPKGAAGFDFAPSDRLQKRAANGYHHLGDLTLRVRKGKAEAWRDYDTAANRAPVTALPVTALPARGHVLASANLAPTLPADSPVDVVRSWTISEGHLALQFRVTNRADEAVDIGGLGIAMVFNNIITDRSLEEAHQKCSFADPYVGRDAGYLQVTRLTGDGPALVVVPDGQTPFEAYQPLDEPMPRQQTFEGVSSWLVRSEAYAHQEWKDAKPWNSPTMDTLAPGQSRTYGVKFLLAPQIRQIEATLAKNNRPVAVGVPGYIVPRDMNARLFLQTGRKVVGMTSEPAGALVVTRDAATPGGQMAFNVRGQGWGRARLDIAYDDGSKQSVFYYLTKAAPQAVNDMGRFLTHESWFVDPNDPFGRSPSAISYDRERDAQVVQDSRVWVAGLGDEGGSGSWLALGMKELGEPKADEVAKYEQFIDRVLWGGLQFKDGPNAYGVKKSLFYYQPDELPAFNYDPKIDWRSWTSWNHKQTLDIGRGYNYPHVVAAYWAMYRVARNHPGLVKNHDWQWYLNQAYQTSHFMFGRDKNGNRRVGYVELGLMEGTVFLEVLQDLQREGWTPQATDMEALMRERADRWKGEAFPFGSEMAWDSTGQEEVYAWSNYFGYDDKARVSLDSITGYMPTLPHWGYNGNARRYWDFLYGGKISRIERQLHHYGSGLNAIPMLTQYRQTPDDFYLLRVGYGGMMGALSNIDEGGFASAAFHSFPQTLKWDPLSGDYGPNFFGHAINTATYIANNPQLGWLCFGGNLSKTGDVVSVAPRDAFRQRVYIAPRGLWLTLDAGTFENVRYNAKTGAVRVELSAATPYLSGARLRIEQPAKMAKVGVYAPTAKLARDAGAYTIPLGKTTTWLELNAK